MGTTSHMAYGSIRQMLLDGELAPGQRVSQSKLARTLGCSTVPVVEAMRLLESDGLLVKTPRKMAKVRKLSIKDLEGFYLLRESLEGIAARLCAKNITTEQIKTLEHLNLQYEECARNHPTEALVSLELKIHNFIAECAGCPVIRDEIKRLVLVERTAGQGNISHNTTSMPHIHKALTQAIADRDLDSAEFLMRKHIRNGYNEIVEEPNGTPHRVHGKR